MTSKSWTEQNDSEQIFPFEILITAVAKDPEHLAKASHGQRKHGLSLSLTFLSQKQTSETSVESEEGRNTTRPDTDIPDFL